MAEKRDSLESTEMDFQVPEFLSANSNLKPQLDNIFAEVEKSLPNIDFDISDVSSEEDVPIFQRQVRTPTLDSDERDLDDSFSSSSTLDEMLRSDRDDLSVERKDSFEFSESIVAAGQRILKELPTERRPKSAGHPQSPQVSRFLHESKDDSSIGSVRSTGTGTDHPAAPLRNTWVDVEDEPSGDSAGQNETKRREVPELSPRGGDAKEKTKSTPRGVFDNAENVVSMFIPKRAPTLPLANVNVDNLVSRALTPTYRRPGEIIPMMPPRIESSGDMPEDEGQDDSYSLIQKLANLSMSQSGTELIDIDPSSGALRNKKSTGSQLKKAKTARNVVVSMEKPKDIPKPSSLNKDMANLPRSALKLPQKKEEDRETVYIDLRGFDKNKQEQQQGIESVQRILHITQPEKSDSESSDEEDLWHEQRKKIKQSLAKGGKLPTESPKKKDVPAPTTVRGQTHAQRLAGHLPPARPKEAHVEEEVDMSDMLTVPPTHPNLVEIEKQRRMDAAKKIREKKEQERQSRLRLGTRLEALRPTGSSRGKLPCAEATPTLYDVDASYEPAPQSFPRLPENPENRDVEIVLLTIHLSGNGEMVAHRSSTNRSVDGAMGLSASYTTLLTWLLSLVPDNFGFLKEMPTDIMYHPAPFHVIGLQQMYLEGQMGLYVAVTPIEHFSDKDVATRGKKSQKRDELKNSTPFQKIITRFLSVSTLETVCPWLQDLVSLEVSSASLEGKTGQPKDAFVYRPPLPNITHKPLSTFIQLNPDPQAAQKVMNIPVGFFWETVDNDEGFCELRVNDDEVDYETQNTMSLIYKRVYHDPPAMMGILNRVLQEGLDLSGVRLVYPTAELLNVASGQSSVPGLAGEDGTARKPSPIELMNNIGPILAVALRGTFARTIWLDAIGPADPVLARRTDPNSLCALYGGESRDECLLFCPRNPSRVLSELSRWFGGRVPPSGVIDVGTSQKKHRHAGIDAKKPKKVTFGDDALEAGDLPTNKPPASLTALTKSDIILAVSPLVPAKCLGIILSTCQRRGFQLRGVRRTRLTSKRAGNLGLSGNQNHIFINDYTDSNHNQAPIVKEELSGPVTLLILQKENAAHNACSLIEGFMVQLSFLEILGNLQDKLGVPLTSGLLFHASPYSDGLANILGGDFSKAPEPELSSVPGYISPKLHTNSEMEQIVVLTLTGFALMKTFGIFLGRLLNMVPYSKSGTTLLLTEGFELLGIKWLPGLSLAHAKELTPYEVGVKDWKRSIQHLTSEPAVILVLRGVNAFTRVESLIAARPNPQGMAKTTPLDRLMSPTPELAHRQATLFFQDRELFPDYSVRPLRRYLPPTRSENSHDTSQARAQKKGKSAKSVKADALEESVLKTMLLGSRPLTTILVAKPDVVRKNLGKLLKKITQENFEVVGMRLAVLSSEDAPLVIPKDDLPDDILRCMHTEYLTGGASLLLALQRENAVKHLSGLMGPDDPKEARKSSSFHWRAVFGSDPIANGLHGSESYLDAVKETKVFFHDGLCCKETLDSKADEVICPAGDSLIGTGQRAQREVKFSGKDVQVSSAPKTKSSGTTGALTLPVTALTQSNCIVLTPLLTAASGKSKKVPYVEIIDFLISHGFEMVGCRMIWFSKEQAEQYLHLCEAGSYALVPLLTSGASIVLALQRDNAVMAFESLLGGSFDKESVFSRYGKSILRPKEVKKACEHIAFFFNELIPESYACIVEKQNSK